MSDVTLVENLLISFAKAQWSPKVWSTGDCLWFRCCWRERSTCAWFHLPTECGLASPLPIRLSNLYSAPLRTSRQLCHSRCHLAPLFSRGEGFPPSFIGKWCQSLSGLFSPARSS